MTKVEALKRLLCAIVKYDATPEQIDGNDVAEVIKNFILYYNGDVGEFVPLSLKSVPGGSLGSTSISSDVNVDNLLPNGNALLVYKTGSKLKLPDYHDKPDDSWKTWDGTSELVIDDGLQICVALISGSGQVIRAGITTVHSNVTGPV